MNFLETIKKRAFIIAEAGSNHDGKLEQAKKLVDAAVEAGVDAVKFQIFSADTLYSKHTPHLSEMKGKCDPSETPYTLLKKLEMPRGWIKNLAEYCKHRKIVFMATPFDDQAVDDLAPYVSIFKVSGYDIDNYPMLEKISEKNKPVVLSTGTSTIDEIKAAMVALKKINRVPVVILHCTNQYPTKHDDVNILAMQTLKKKFAAVVGLSDHTIGNEAAVAAVALGGRVFEKHFTLDKSLPGPDHPFAANPSELKSYVHAIRTAEKMLGSAVKRPAESEGENRRLARRSIHAKVDIPAGTKITREMLILKRPALGIKPGDMGKVAGRKAKRDIKADEWLTWKMIK
jgi:N-acetylneuraminate synthase/N,N'-diacetyllegionaminate synthase